MTLPTVPATKRRTMEKTSSSKVTDRMLRQRAVLVGNGRMSMVLEASKQTGMKSRPIILASSNNGAVASTHEGVTTLSNLAFSHDDLPEILAHEAVHRAQFYSRGGLPIGTRSQLESDAVKGAGNLLSGSDYNPSFSAPAGMSLQYDPGDNSEQNMTYERFESHRDYFLEDVHENPLLWGSVNVQKLKSADELTRNVLRGLGTGFSDGFIAGIDKELIRKFVSGLDDDWNAETFKGGIIAGILIGAVKDVYHNIKFLLDLVLGAAKLSASIAYALNPTVLAFNSVRFAFNIGDYRDEVINSVKNTISTADEILDEIRGLVEALVAELLFSQEPLFSGSYEFGYNVGGMVVQKINEELFGEDKSYFDRGSALGEVIGAVLMEIILLFIAVEVVIAKGLIKTAEGARILARARLLKNARFAEKVSYALRNSPKLRKLLGLSDESRDVRRIIENASEVAHTPRIIAEEPPRVSIKTQRGVLERSESGSLEWSPDSGRVSNVKQAEPSVTIQASSEHSASPNIPVTKNTMKKSTLTSSEATTLSRKGLSDKSIEIIDRLRSAGVKITPKQLRSAGKDTIDFINSFHNRPGFDEVIKSWSQGGRSQEGARFVMKYCNTNLKGKAIRFEVPVGVKKIGADIEGAAGKSEVAARFVDLVIEGESKIYPGNTISVEFKSWMSKNLVKARGSIGKQFVRDSALFNRNEIKWVFDSKKVTEEEVIDIFVKIIENDRFLQSIWGTTKPEMKKSLSRIIEMFPK